MAVGKAPPEPTASPEPGSNRVPTAAAVPGPPSPAKPLWPAAVWIVGYLLALALFANVFCAYPADPRNVSPTRAQQYFEYGRSIEGKLARMTRSTDAESAPIVASGWLVGEDALVVNASGGAPSSARPVVTLYGMSYAHLLARDLAEEDPNLTVRSQTAPQGVPTWSFTAYLLDRQRQRSDIVVLSIMTDTIALLSATAGTTMYFDGAYPYTWPHYFLRDGRLESVAPPFLSVEDYRRHFFRPEDWRRYTGWLAENDPYYDPVLFHATPLDRSSLIRLLRRSYAVATRRARMSKAYDPIRGFNPASEEVRILEALTVEFARRARLDGSIPIVYIVNNQAGGPHAFTLLRPLLVRHGIPYLSSHEICPPSDRSCYMPDSHFVPSKNRELARAMARLAHEQLEGRQARAE
jgi:hypothetical protein